MTSLLVWEKKNNGLNTRMLLSDPLGDTPIRKTDNKIALKAKVTENIREEKWDMSEPRELWRRERCNAPIKSQICKDKKTVVQLRRSI